MATPTPTITKIKYLTNKDLLEEIQRSKMTFCSYIESEHSRYDFIVSDITMITKERLTEARNKKLSDLQAIEKKEAGKAVKDFKSSITIDDISEESIVIRVMSYVSLVRDPRNAPGNALTSPLS